MKQHIVHDPASAEYAGGLEAVWTEWEPSLRRLERMLHTGPLLLEQDPERLAGTLRRIQYRAHTSSELVTGLRPPLAAADSHDYLLAALDGCRDTLAVLAERAEAEELDEHMGDLGLQSASATRDAFKAARMSSQAAFRFAETLDPLYLQQAYIEEEERNVGPMLWALVIVCSILFTVLLVEVLFMNPPA